jgi:hypothetical protein
LPSNLGKGQDVLDVVRHNVHADVGVVVLHVFVSVATIVASSHDVIPSVHCSHVYRIRRQKLVFPITEHVGKKSRDVKNVNDAVTDRKSVAQRRLSKKLCVGGVCSLLYLKYEQAVLQFPFFKSAAVDRVSQCTWSTDVETEKCGFPFRVTPKVVVRVHERRPCRVMLHECKLNGEKIVRNCLKDTSVGRIVVRRKVKRALTRRRW